MAKKTNENRYSGVDSVPWRVKNAAGESVLKNSKDETTFNSFSAADSAAKRYTTETGEWAAAVRS